MRRRIGCGMPCACRGWWVKWARRARRGGVKGLASFMRVGCKGKGREVS